MLKCGIYESDITPLPGMPGCFHERPASGIRERLTSEAIYLENDGECIVPVSNDSESMAADVLRTMREKISEALDIPVHCACVCATHSHTAGSARKTFPHGRFRCRSCVWDRSASMPCPAKFSRSFR